MKVIGFILTIIFTLAGWVSSIIALIAFDRFTPFWQSFWILLIVILSIIYIVFQIASFGKNHIYTHKTETEVNNYLLNWLQQGSRTVIFTRDLTWGNAEGIKPELIKKAENKELIICLHKKTGITNTLEGLGAEIYVHNLNESQLKSRFTIIDYGKHNPKITVGTRDTLGHFINERYDMESNPNACHAFIELYELVQSQSISVNK